jgi:hypothetical protein
MLDPILLTCAIRRLDPLQAWILSALHYGASLARITADGLWSKPLVSEQIRLALCAIHGSTIGLEEWERIQTLLELTPHSS